MLRYDIHDKRHGLRRDSNTRKQHFGFWIPNTPGPGTSLIYIDENVFPSIIKSILFLSMRRFLQKQGALAIPTDSYSCYILHVTSETGVLHTGKNEEVY